MGAQPTERRVPKVPGAPRFRGMAQNLNPNLLPSGTWLRISNLPPGTTEEDLHEFLKAHGIDCGADCFSVKEFDNGKAGAILAAPDELLPALVKWALGGDCFQGCELEFRNWKSPEQHRRRR